MSLLELKKEVKCINETIADVLQTLSAMAYDDNPEMVYQFIYNENGLRRKLIDSMQKMRASLCYCEKCCKYSKDYIPALSADSLTCDCDLEKRL